jgi:uncharacterized integral membrane protein
MSRLIKLLLVLAVVCVGLLFHLRNAQYVPFDYYLGVLELPFSLWLSLALFCGALLGVMSCLPTMFRARRERARSQRLQNEPRAADTGSDETRPS